MKMSIKYISVAGFKPVGGEFSVITWHTDCIRCKSEIEIEMKIEKGRTSLSPK